MGLKGLTPKVFYYKPAANATLSQLRETGRIINNFINKGRPNARDIGNEILTVPVPYTKKCWFSSDYKLNPVGKKWINDLLKSLGLKEKASLSDLVIRAVRKYKNVR